MTNPDYVSSMIRSLSFQKENIILDQLNDLISRGLLVVEETQPVLIREYDSAKITLRQSVKLTLLDKEYIEKLEAENNKLRNELKKIKEVLSNVEG